MSLRKLKVNFAELRSSMDNTHELFSTEEIQNLLKHYTEIERIVSQKLKDLKDAEKRKLNIDAKIKPEKRSNLRKSTSERIKAQKQKNPDIKELEPGKEEKRKKCKSRKSEKSGVENTESKETEKPAPGNRRYSKREVPRKNYKVRKDLDEDDFLFCDDCNRAHQGSCPVHGSLKFVENKNVPQDGSVPDRAFCTIPQGLSICPSSIKGAGKGVWADIPLRKGVVFGPYDGLVTDKVEEAQRSGYSWVVYKGGKPQKYVDGEDTSKSNWLRFVNCADCEERQNLIAFQYKGKIFYRTYKPIDIGTEFLVWYGDEYAKELGINIEESESTEGQDMPEPGSEGYKCERCDILFSNKVALTRHESYKHWIKKEGKYKCQYCTYTSDLKPNVSRHERMHTGEKPYKCSECEKAFSLKHHLRTHLLHHTGERPYSCNICGKSFSQCSNVIRHKRIHRKKMDHMCKFCGKTFLLRVNLLPHERMHIGQRPYKCNQCSKRFTELSTLKSHVMYKHTRNFRHTCPHCNKGFDRPNKLVRHLRVHQLNKE